MLEGTETTMPEKTDATMQQELVSLMESRANVYRVLSRCFREEVDAAFATEFATEFAFESEDARLMEPVAAMREALAGADEDALEQLAVTFDRVFFGMGPLTARHAFPYESVYTSDKGIMMQEAYTQVVRAYREQQLAKDASFTEPEDHIAVELAFMATLADRAAAFLREGREEAATETVQQQLSFANGHLLNWLDRFCIDLRAAADGTLYAQLADLTERFVAADAQLLSEMLQEDEA